MPIALGPPPKAPAQRLFCHDFDWALREWSRTVFAPVAPGTVGPKD